MLAKYIIKLRSGCPPIAVDDKSIDAFQESVAENPWSITVHETGPRVNFAIGLIQHIRESVDCLFCCVIRLAMFVQLQAHATDCVSQVVATRCHLLL